MARSQKALLMTPTEKRQVIKSAFDRLNAYLASKDYLAANIIAFSILEERTLTAYIRCFQVKNKTTALPSPKVNKEKFSRAVDELLSMNVIDSTLSQDLKNARTHLAHERFQGITSQDIHESDSQS
jgi:signal transduction histidine kinase